MKRFAKEKIERKKEIVSVMAECFQGNPDFYARQDIYGEWSKRSVGCNSWNNLLEAHISHRITIGVYPILRNGFVHVMAVDLDDHKNEYGKYELCRNTVLPVIHWFNKLNVTDNQILIEDSGMGYHLWFYSKVGMPARYAVAFLEGARAEYGVEIFPNNAKPEKVGNAIRLPLGIHMKRAKIDFDNAVSCLCKVEHGMIERITNIEATIEILRSWQPLGWEEINVVTAEDEGAIDDEKPVCITDDSLARIRDNESRACIRHILTYPTHEGRRENVAFNLALYMKNALGVKAEDICSLMYAWNDSLTIPKMKKKSIDNNIRGAMEMSAIPGCANKTLSKLCFEKKLQGTCPFKLHQKSLPVPDKGKFIRLSQGKSSLHKVELALRKLYHNHGDNPLLDNRWFRVTYSEVARLAGLKISTIQGKLTSGQYIGRKVLDVLKDQNILDYKTTQGSKYLLIRLDPVEQGSSSAENREVSGSGKA